MASLNNLTRENLENIYDQYRELVSKQILFNDTEYLFPISVEMIYEIFYRLESLPNFGKYCAEQQTAMFLMTIDLITDQLLEPEDAN